MKKRTFAVGLVLVMALVLPVLAESNAEWQIVKKGKPGAVIPVTIPFDRDWVLEYDARVTGISGFCRLFNGNEGKHYRRIDTWTTNGRGFKIRLANKRIFFTKSHVGEIANPGKTSDHCLVTTVKSIQKGGHYTFRVLNLFSLKRLKVYVNGKLVGDATYEVKDMPSSLKELLLDASGGEVRFKVLRGRKGDPDDDETGKFDDSSDSMDDVLDSLNTGSGGQSAIRLDRKNQGTRIYAFAGPGVVKVTPFLSTRGDARISVIIRKADGTEVQWMNWHRANDGDASPLHVYGQPVTSSIFFRSPGDASPADPKTYTYKGSKGDTIILSLNGNFGDGRAFLSLQASRPGARQGGGKKPGGQDQQGGKVPSKDGMTSYQVVMGQDIPVTLPFNQSWVIEAKGTFRRGGEGNRYFVGREGDRALDIFPFHADIAFRLSKNNIFFTSDTRLGHVSNPYGSGRERADHVAGTVKGVNIGDKRVHALKLEYLFEQKRFKASVDGRPVMDVGFVVVNMPGPLKSIHSWGFTGTFGYRVGKGNN